MAPERLDIPETLLVEKMDGVRGCGGRGGIERGQRSNGKHIGVRWELRGRDRGRLCAVGGDGDEGHVAGEEDEEAAAAGLAEAAKY